MLDEKQSKKDVAVRWLLSSLITDPVKSKLVSIIGGQSYDKSEINRIKQQEHGNAV